MGVILVFSLVMSMSAFGIAAYLLFAQKIRQAQMTAIKDEIINTFKDKSTDKKVVAETMSEIMGYDIERAYKSIEEQNNEE